VEAQEPVEQVESVEQVEAVEPVLPRPVTGGKRPRFDRGLEFTSGTCLPIDLSQQLDAIDAEHNEQVLSNRKIGQWTDIEKARVAAWQRENNDDASTRLDFTKALKAMADELGRTFRGTFDQVWKIRNNVPVHEPKQVVVPRKIVPNDTAVVSNFKPGDKVNAKHNGSVYRHPATVMSVFEGTYTIAWDDKDTSDTLKKAHELFPCREAFKSASRPPPRIRQVSESADEGSSGDVMPQVPATNEIVDHGDVMPQVTATNEIVDHGDVIPQVTATNEIVDQSRYYDEEEEQPEAEQSRYTKTQEQEFLKSWGNRLRQMSQSNGAAAVLEARAPDPWTSDDGFDEMLQVIESENEQEIKTMNMVFAEDAANRTKKYVQELDELIVLYQLHLQALEATAAVSPQREMSPINGAAATYARTEEDEHLVQELAATANEAAPREMSLSNGAAATAATAATAAPAGPRMLNVEDITLKYMSKIFRVDKSKIPPEPLKKLELTLEGLIEMEKQGVISVTFGAERSIFGMSTIVVNDPDRWIEVMKRQAKEYTIDFYKETKNYQATIYLIPNMLGFSTERKDTNEVAWLKYGKEKRHMCHNVWNYSEEIFRKNSPRFLQR
jgi:hypothetical protein